MPTIDAQELIDTVVLQSLTITRAEGEIARLREELAERDRVISTLTTIPADQHTPDEAAAESPATSEGAS